MNRVGEQISGGKRQTIGFILEGQTCKASISRALHGN
jgi:hypothetical protein